MGGMDIVMNYFFGGNKNEDPDEQKKVGIKDGTKENVEVGFKDDFMDEFEKSVIDSNLSDEIKTNLMKMVNMSRSRESKKFQENQMKAQEQARREQKRISRLRILERIIKEIDIDKIRDKEEEIIDSIRGRRFKEGGVCPHCGYKKIWKYGKYCGKQRYKCKSQECGKTFSDRTLSPMYCSKKGIDKWIEYMKCMVRGLSLRECSHIVGINIATSFYWRHKIMDGLRENMGRGCVGGIAEIGHMVVVESIKGNRNKKGERGCFNRGRTCGIKNKYTLIFNQDKAKTNYVVCAVDRNGNIIVEACNNRRVDKGVLEMIFCGNITCGTILCTQGNRHYHQFAKMMELSLGRSCTGDDNEEYHIGNLIGIKREINIWLDSFKGVSSKYLTNYLYWYRWMKENKVYDGESEGCNDDNHSAAQCLFLESHTKYTGMIIKDFKDRKPIYINAA